jgi:hypothetical protein
MTTRLPLVLPTVVLIIGLSGIFHAQVPDTRQGNTVREFIAAFNSGNDAAMGQFFGTEGGTGKQTQALIYCNGLCMTL